MSGRSLRARKRPPSFGVELGPIDERDGGKIERDIAAFARAPNRGLIVTASSGAAVYRELIIMLAARHRLPAVYPSATSSPTAA